MYVFQLLDHYACNGACILFLCIFESLALGWLFGTSARVCARVLVSESDSVCHRLWPGTINNLSSLFTDTNQSWLQPARLCVCQVHSSCSTSSTTCAVWQQTGSLSSAGVTSLPCCPWWVWIYSWITLLVFAPACNLWPLSKLNMTQCLFFPQTCFICSLVWYQPLTFNRSYTYPNWAHVLGWGLALSSILFIPGWALYKLATGTGSLREVGYLNYQ